ncbi:hypothetical protein ACF1BN_33835 [Streptomyces sp. NPDC014861]|uniref:hypothetical protein n=1 Tax=Streptomyces sp. NPDC014861 TaxID=3364923 RepID=UPI0036FA8B5B
MKKHLLAAGAAVTAAVAAAVLAAPAAAAPAAPAAPAGPATAASSAPAAPAGPAPAAPAVLSAPAPAVVTTAVVTTAVSATASATPSTAPSTVLSAAPSSAVRTVRSGERVDAGGGHTIWLTRQGKHWTGPDGVEQFRSVVDGNLDLTRPALSHQGEGTFHSGVHGGPVRPGRVEVTDSEGRVTRATLLQLPGRPGWGVWYAHTAPTGHDVSVAFYSGKGRLLVELPALDH